MRLQTLLLAPAIALAGCATTGQIDNTLMQIQSYVQLACKYIPTIEAIALIVSHSPTNQTVKQLGDAICGVIPPAPTQTASVRGFLAAPITPELYDIPITGRYVN